MTESTFNQLRPVEQEKIMRAAIGELNAKGPAATSMAAIAAKSGISEEALRQYFADVENLTHSAFIWGITYFMGKMGQDIGLGEMDIFDYLEKELELRVAMIMEEKELTLFMQDLAVGKYGCSFSELVRSVDEMMRSVIHGLIKNGQTKGTIRADIDAPHLESFFTGALLRTKQEWIMIAAQENISFSDARFWTLIKPSLEDFTEILKNGFRAR